MSCLAGSRRRPPAVACGSPLNSTFIHVHDNSRAGFEGRVRSCPTITGNQHTMDDTRETDGWRPVAAAERHAALDVLRGLALLGVLVVNLLSDFRVSLAE